MTKSTSIKISWTLFSNLFYAATQFFTLSLIAKLGGPEEVGGFTLAMAICSPIFLLLNVKLRSVVLTDFKQENTAIEFVKLRDFTNIASIFIVFVIILLIDISNYLKLAILFLAISKVLEMKIDIYYGFYQKQSRFDLVGKSTILRGFLNLILAFTSYFIFRNLVAVMLSFVISNFAIYCLYDRKASKLIEPSLQNNRKKNINYKKIYSLFILALPLGISTVIGSLNTNFPRYIIEKELGLYELGIFSALTYLLVIGNTFLSAISQVVTPKLAYLSSQKSYRSFIKLLALIVLIGTIISLIMITIFYFFGEGILTILYTSEYAEYKDILMIIVCGMTFLYSSVFLGTAITALRLFKVQPIVNGIGLLVTILSSIVLINIYSLKGIAIALVLNYLIVSLCYLICIISIFKKRGIQNVKSNSIL